METLSVIKLGLTGFGVVGLVYVCFSAGFLGGGETGWWEGLPKQKKIIFIAAIAATVLQTFL